MPPKTKLWPLEPHTVGKHLVLKHYLEGWFPILGTWNGRILFIDGFAGPGEYAGGEEGSPLIALRTFSEHQSRAKIKAEVVFDFVESDEARAKHLEAVIERAGLNLPEKCRVEVIHGKFNETMTSLLEAIEDANKHLAPAFVMLDPFGISDTPMAVIERILRNPRSEIYVSFMYEAINRFKASKEFAQHLDGPFGCTNWRDGLGIAEPERRKDFFYSLYRNQLRRAGAKYVVYFELYNQNRLVYAIFFGTQNIKGSNLIKQAIWKVAPFGDFAFHGTNSRQLTLGASPDFKPLIDALMQEFRGRGFVPISDIEEFVMSDRTDYQSGQLRNFALKPLEDAGKIEVDPESRTKRRTYPPGTRIRFI